MDILQKLRAIVNISDLTLETQHFNIKMYTESNRGSELHILDETSKSVVKLPVNIDNGAFWCETTKISDDILISGGLYQARNKFSFM